MTANDAGRRRAEQPEPGRSDGRPEPDTTTTTSAIVVLGYD
ncbi:hypothetical protein [Curtobacterium luteum]|nr:hypothetical protein [Curtobacterium luteum]